MARKKFFSIPIVFIGLLFINSLAMAEVTEEPVVIDGDKVEYSDEHKMIHAFGNVIVNYKNMTMTADKVAFDVENKEAVAEGNVNLYKDESVFRGDRGRYDFKTERGIVSEVKFFSMPVYGAAGEAEKVGKKNYIAKHGYFTTCSFDKPHYRIQSKSISVYLDEKIVAKHVIFYIVDFPFMYLPYYSYSLRDDRPRVTVIPGKSKEWGFYVLSAWRYRVTDDFMGRVYLDWREKMGVAEGFTHTYKTKKFGEGVFHGYYMQERRRDIAEGLKAEEERFRVVLTHDWQPDNKTDVFLEYHRQSDVNFNKDFFYTEYIKDPLPESHFSFTKRYPRSVLNFYTRTRVNQFETVIQELPQVKFDTSGYQLGDTKFYFDNKTNFANFNKKTANLGSAGGASYYYTTDTHTVRLDSCSRLSYPSKLPGYFKWLNSTPYVDFRESWYRRDKEGDKRDFFRNAYGGGYNLTTKIFRIWDTERDFLGVNLNKLRHLITPSIDYGYNHDPSVAAEKLEAFDGIDGITSSKIYTFKINNKLQTKWNVAEGEPETVNLVDFDSWIYLQPQKEGRSFSDLFFALRIMPFRWLLSTASSTYNWVSGDFEVFNLDFSVTKPSWELAATHRFISDSYSETDFRALYQLSSKWKVGCYERYDFTRKRLNEQEYFLARDFHDWIIELTWNIEKIEGESVLLVFRNKAFPKAPLEFETSYHAPKVGSQSEPAY